MAYTLFSKSFGIGSANYQVQITDSSSGTPARILNSSGALVSDGGWARLDSSGNLSVYIDTARSWSVNVIDEDIRSVDPSLLSTTEAAATRSFVSGVWNIAPTSDQAAAVTTRRTTMRPRIRLASALLTAHATAVVAAGGTAPTSAQYDAIRPHLETLMRSSAWPKLRVLWLPMGADGDLNAMRTALVEASGTSALINTGFVSGDYTAAGGLVGGASKKLVTAYSPSAAATAAYPALTATAWGFGAFALGYTLASTVLIGTDASSSAYVGFGGTNVSQMFGGTQAPHWPTKLLQSVQTVGGAMESWTGAARRGTSAGSGSLPSGGISLNAVNGSLNGSHTYGGLWVGEAMTLTEMRALSEFFIDANTALGRAVYSANPTYHGDSIVLGSTNISTSANKFIDRLSAMFGATSTNQGANGRSMSNFAGQTASLVWSDETQSGGYWARVLRDPGSINLIAVGVNDSNNAVPVATFAADYSRVLGNIILAGIRPETIVLVSPWYQPGGSQPVNDATSQAMGTALRTLAATYGCCYVDALNDSRIRSMSAANWDSLGVHGNDAVHGQMYLSVRDAIAASWASTPISAL